MLVCSADSGPEDEDPARSNLFGETLVRVERDRLPGHDRILVHAQTLLEGRDDGLQMTGERGLGYCLVEGGKNLGFGHDRTIAVGTSRANGTSRMSAIPHAHGHPETEPAENWACRSRTRP